MKPILVLVLILTFLLTNCTNQVEYRHPFFPDTIDGVTNFSMTNHTKEDHFSGNWEAPVLIGKERKTSRRLSKGSGTLEFTLIKKEKYILETDFQSPDKTSLILLNGNSSEIKGRKKFLNGDKIKAGKNSLSFIHKKGLKFYNISVYPKRILRIKEYEKLIKNEKVMFLPGSLRFYVKAEKSELIRMKLKLNVKGNVGINIVLKADEIKKESQKKIKSGENFEIELLEGKFQEIIISFPSLDHGYLKIMDSFLVSRNQNFDEGQKKTKEIQNLAKNKNLLFILLDATRNDRTGYNGYSSETTPNIDKFSKDSLIFGNSYSEASYTLASTGTLLTGLPPDFHGVISSFYSALNKNTTTLAELFLQKNYFTGAVSSNPNFGKTYKFNRGFSVFHELFVDHPVVHAEELLAPFKTMLDSTGDKPFFIYLHFREPHDPYEIPAPFLTKFQNKYSEVSKDIPSVFRASRNDYKDNKDIDEILNKLYDGNLAYGDMVFGKVIDILNKRKLTSETVIVFLSDHGEAIGEHGVYGHGHVLYQQTIRIPLIVKIPGLGGENFNSQVITSDLVRTLTDIFDLPFPYKNKSYGKNLFTKKDGRRLVTRSINAFNYPGYTIQQYPYKLIVHFPLSEKNIVLFDLKNDPDENNIIKNEPLIKNTLLFYLFNHLSSAEEMKHEAVNPKLRKGDIESLESLGYL